MPNFDPKTVCAVVLAGGMGSRMGGVDKGLQLLAGQPLARHCVQRLQAQVGGAPGQIAINANRNADIYAAWGCPVWADTMGGFAGPLAGFQTAMQHCAGASVNTLVSASASGSASASALPEGCDYLLTVACDTPRFPLDLLARLGQALEHEGADIAVAAAPEIGRDGAWSLRKQPVFCLMRTSVADSLNAYLSAGGRKVDAWTAQHRTVTVAFDRPHDDALAFFNANTLDELGRLEASANPAP
jgi:molybdopterin-guanine dinucleotide biosynthesis protein A